MGSKCFFGDGLLHVEYDDYLEDHPILRGFPSGKRTKNYGTSPCLMGKSTIKWLCVFCFLSFWYVYQKVANFIHRLQHVCYNPSYQALVTPMIHSGSRSLFGASGIRGVGAQEITGRINSELEVPW